MDAADRNTEATRGTTALSFQTLESRIAVLELAHSNSRPSRFQQYASLAALLIGIALSAFSLFDIFWTKPREALFHDIEEFNKAVNAVANLRQSMIQVQHQSQDQRMVFAMNAMVTPQVLANIQYATALLPRLGDHAGIPQLIVLISEAINIYDWSSAAVLVDRAVSTKHAVPSLQSEARRYKGRLMFLLGKVQEGRKAYEDAVNVLRTETGFGVNGARAYIVADWAIAELSLGDCSASEERLRQFATFVSDPQVLPPARLGLVGTLRSQIEQLQTSDKRCPRPLALDALA